VAAVVDTMWESTELMLAVLVAAVTAGITQLLPLLAQQILVAVVVVILQPALHMPVLGVAHQADRVSSSFVIHYKESI
jgi:hypothetical protein